jgi:hypothetical protein
MQEQNTPTIITVELICEYCQQFPENHEEVMEINHYGYHLQCKKDADEMEDERQAAIMADLQFINFYQLFPRIWGL